MMKLAARTEYTYIPKRWGFCLLIIVACIMVNHDLLPGRFHTLETDPATGHDLPTHSLRKYTQLHEQEETSTVYFMSYHSSVCQIFPVKGRAGKLDSCSWASLMG